ncbi:MAG: radical SAM protein [Anaerolineae bacterium]|nr:radical SAM protein [Gloeobacterales cyanobacterium ES-bin-313]
MERSRTIEWQTNGICNYDCSYCIQSKKYRQGHPSDEEIDGFLAFFASLPGSWEIKMSGGEPFAFPGFLGRIVPGLAQLPHRVSVLTNLSAPAWALRRFVDLVGDKLVIISASLHREFISVEGFLEKAVLLRSWLRPETALVVNSVLVPGTLTDLQAVREAVQAAGLRYFPQVMKTKAGTYAYTSEDQSRVTTMTGSQPTSHEANLAPSYRGRLCWAGVDYFVLDQRGNAFSCRTAKRFGEGYLGNVLAGDCQLHLQPERCRYDICPCTVPANRGMIEGIGVRYG